MKIKFIPQNVEVEVDPNKSIMRIAHENNLPIKSVCNGLPSCAECRVQVEEGEHNTLPPTSEELSLIGSGHFVDRRRLACQLKCFGPMVIDLSEQVEKERLGGSKRPQGYLRKDSTEESLAVTGNLIDADEELLKSEDFDVSEEVMADSGSEAVVLSDQKPRISRPAKNRKKPSKSKPESNTMQAKDKNKSGDSKKTVNKNRGRNRNRSRSRNKKNKPSKKSE